MFKIMMAIIQSGQLIVGLINVNHVFFHGIEPKPIVDIFRIMFHFIAHTIIDYMNHQF